MNLSLSGKNALVCGASRGIGRASAVVLAQLGANVTVVARNAGALEALAQQLPNTGQQQHYFIALDFAELEKVKLELAKRLSHSAYHILVNNNAGPASGPIVDATAEQFENAFRQHVITNHTLASLLIPGMKDHNYGRIINIISTSVKIPLKNLGVSNTIRAAVANWSKTLAGELASYGITVNNVLPGATDTQRLQEIIQNTANRTGKTVEEVSLEMQHEIPMRRFAAPEEIAAAVGFLASTAASYITGINVPVDGGRTGCL